MQLAVSEVLDPLSKGDASIVQVLRQRYASMTAPRGLQVSHGVPPEKGLCRHD